MRATIHGVFRRSHLAGSGLAIVLAALSSQALAQEQTRDDSNGGVTLNPIVIKNAKAKANAKPGVAQGAVPRGSVTDTPLASTTTADDIRKKDIDSLKDVGNTTEPGVTFSKGGDVNIRGLDGDRVLTTIDGIPIPHVETGSRGGLNEVRGGGVDSYDFSALSTLDVLYGADASRVGGGAMGGALVLRTLEPEDLLAPGKMLVGVAKLTYDGSDRSIVGSAAVAQRVRNTSLLYQGSYQYGHELQNTGDVGGYGAARTESDPMDYHRSNLMFKLRQQLEGGHIIGITAERNRFDSDTDIDSDPGTTYDNKRYYQDQINERDRVSLDYRYKAPSEDSLVNNAFATIYWQRVHRNVGLDAYRISSLKGPYTRDYDLTQQQWGATGSANLGFDTGRLTHSLTLGGDFSFAQSKQYMSGEDNCTRGTATFREQMGVCPFLHINQSDTPKVDAYRLGLFAEDKITMGDSRFSVTPGVRFDWYRYEPKMTEEYEKNYGFSKVGLPNGASGNRFSPKVRFAYQATPDLELFTQLSTTYRAPTVDEMYLNYTSAYYASWGNPNLKAESGYGIDVGARYGDKLSGGKVTFFANRYKNFIDTVQLQSDLFPYGITTYRNLNRARIAGVEAEAHHTFQSGFDVHGSVAYSKPVNLDDDIALNSAVPLKGVVGVGYNTDFWGVDASVVAAAHLKQVYQTTSGKTTRRVPGYGVVNLTGWWEPKRAKGMRLQAGVYNLFNQEYYDAAALGGVTTVTERFSEAGRYFKVSLTQKF
ncbi:MAG: TonB-dependent hemoglobin/transferrin/lactoferrin family receptor [Rhizobiales bacterium]|nr:TonB-dependent hemoglobin/transferrin/lactoferrin family receptor [Hyphomicrobiales bacterium]